jgi:Flp pilus assembly protein TadG
MVHRGRRAESGSAMIEFAMIAPVFFLLLFASLESGMMFFAHSTLQNAVMDTARLIRTGQAQEENMSQSDFRAQVCARIAPFLSCDGETLHLDIRAYASFGDPGIPAPIDEQGQLSGDIDNFQLGESSEDGEDTLIMYRAFYKWQLYTPLFGQYLSNLDGNVRLLTSSAAFRNEPF